jgi:antitoxin component YwqK of YwqJK toxin-antitoxin module
MSRSEGSEAGSSKTLASHFPTLRARPEPDGPYVDPDPTTGQPRVTGQHISGRREGEWRWFGADGALRRCAHYRADRLHGPLEALHANGQPSVRGAYLDGARHGTFTTFAANGTRIGEAGYARGVKHGNTDEYFPSGQLKNRYRYVNGEIERPILKYHANGQLEKEDTADVERTLFADGSLSLEYPLLRGNRHGKARSFNEDGTPDFECEYVMDVKHGVETTWKDGKPTVVHYLCGAPADKVKTLKKLGAQLAKKRDHFERGDLLREHTDGGYTEATRLLWHLIREGLYDASKDFEMWSALGADSTITGKDVVAFLSSLTTFENGDDRATECLPGWPRYLDEMVCAVYARDPGPIDAALEKLPPLVRDGVRTVRARFGHDERAKLPRDMAKKLAATYLHVGIGDQIGGQRREVRWFRDGKLRDVNIGDTTRSDIPNADFWPFIELFTTRERFTTELAKLALAGADELPQLPVYRLADVLRDAEPAEMQKLLEAHRIGGADLPYVLESLRRDTPQTLLGWAKSVESERTSEVLASLAILRAVEAGQPIPTEADAFLGKAASLTDVDISWRNVSFEPKSELDWIEQELPSLPGAIRFGDPAAICDVTHDLYRRALAALPRERTDAILQRFFAGDSYQAANAISLAVPYLTPALTKQIVAFAAGQEPTFYGSSKRLALGLACLAADALPLVLEAKRKTKQKKLLPFYERALMYSLAAMAVRGETWDEVYDEHVTFGPGHKRDEYPFDRDYEHALRVILAALPSDRALAIFRRAYAQKPDIALRTFVAAGHHPVEEVLRPAFELLLADKLKIERETQQRITEALALLREDGPRIVEWVLANRKKEAGDLQAAFWQCMGAEYWSRAEPEEEVDYRDRAAAERLDALQEALSELEGKHKKTPIYAPLPGRPEKPGYNQIGGAPRGIGAKEWPMASDGDPMEFLLMIDLADLPELQTRVPEKGCRAVAMFISSADHHRAFEPGNDETKLLFLDEAALASEAAPPPEGAKLHEERSFAWKRVEVPKAIFELDEEEDEDDEEDDGGSTAQLRRVRSAVYGLGARAHGDPIWPRSPEWCDRFLLQFDETFVPMNLATNGVMFVFADTAFFRR